MPGVQLVRSRAEIEAQAIDYLKKQGYQVSPRATVRGKSGVEYTFDVVATTTSANQVTYTLGMDFFIGDKEIGLEQVAAFDTKAYDCGIDAKAIVVLPKLSAQAKQLAQFQKVKVIEVNEKPIAELLDAGIAPPKPVEPPPVKTTGTGPAPAKPEKKSLRHIAQPEAVQLIPESVARRYNAIPLTITGNALEVAMANPADVFALEAFAALTKMRIKPVPATAKEVREALDFNYKGMTEIERQVSQVNVATGVLDEKLTAGVATDAPLSQALDLIVEEAAKARTSDIHFEPEEDRLRVRYRIDGTLQDMMSLPLNIHRALISRLKILADMNIADHYRPQDGQFSVDSKGRHLDIRVATAPTIYGEMAVLRLLDKSMAMRGLPDLGFLPETLAKYESLLKIPYGMILVSGPTGSGKTTTLYASISAIDTIGRNIITIEDPAEYRLKDINQIQVNVAAGITFAAGLRSILRLDPNVILVGEIRDAETARIAIQAALTGHLMLSSIHANDTVGVVFRLMDIGIEPFLIASALIGVVAQRMVRRVCPDCGHMIKAPVVEQVAYEKVVGEKRTEFLYGTGCKTCSYTGYLGRVGLYELLAMSDTLRVMIANRAGSAELRQQALKEGMVPMIVDGMRKVKQGTTTPTEVLRVAFTAE
ncbi:MAG: type II/IV secretion system protein [Chloroflexi bacterium]|nr:type II/IV secretion system protein [Chloroflexota bacterium]